MSAGGRSGSGSQHADPYKVEHVVDMSTQADVAVREEATAPSVGYGLSLINVVGQEEAKQALREALLWPRMKPFLFQALGISPPVGVLLVGPPGTGKTLLARETAKELKCGFIALQMTDVVSKWGGA